METKSAILSRTLVSPLFLFGNIIITVFFMVAIVYHWTAHFTAKETPINLHYFTAQKLKEFGGSPVVVDVGLYINDFYKFDMNNDEFIFNGILTYEFDPSLTSLATLENFAFERGEVLLHSKPTTYLSNGRMFARYDLRVKISSQLNYAWFPFEDHRVSIVFINKLLTPTDLIFKTKDDNFIVPDMASVGWHKFGSKAEAGYLDIPLEDDLVSYPAIIFSVDYGRYTNVRNIFTIILPMLMLFFIALFSLIIDPRDSFTFVLAIPVQTIAGLIAFRFVIEGMSPKVGYFMYSDYFFFFFLFLMFSILLFHSFGKNMSSLSRKIIIVFYNSLIIAFLWWCLSR